MRVRSPALLLGLALSGCLVLLVCALVVGYGGYVLVTRANPSTPSRAATNRIVYLGNDLNVYVADAAGANKVALTQDGDGGNTHAYDYPTWAPDGQHIAFVGVTFANGNTDAATLYSASVNGNTRTELYKTAESIPFYLYWSPDSHHLGFLSSKGTRRLVSLHVAQSDRDDSEEIDAGSPLYWAWSPDSQRLLMHLNGARSDSNEARLALLALGQNSPAQSLSSHPGSFQAPQWSPDGKFLLFSTQDADRREAVAITNAQGDNPRVLFAYNGRVSFAWAPQGDRIAYIATAAQRQLPHFGHVQVVDSNGQNAQDLSNENALAFFWAPSGKRLAYVTATLAPNGYRWRGLAQQGETRVRVQWKVHDFENGATRAVATFAPTDNLINVLPYFDQYALSSTFWSPDSQALVYVQREGEDDGSVWIADVVGDAPPRKVGEGLIAFWSWH